MIAYGLHPDAYLDLEEIQDFVAQDSPNAATKVIEEIFAKIELAAQFPQIGHRNTRLTAQPLRFLHVRDYVIAYAEEQPLWVIAVVHGRRSPRVLAAIFRSRP